ncbi:uncharacterized protein LOC127148650 [Cucumis melo]|uniref:Uncharacterized protein LOC127148650 n=1 Tax=Cucumis melo TaxID=3656 RepID=A0ABM3KLY4_CUCME|nr:uncharacterized protein LOC127148650 [Cucumis melo]
MAEITNREEEVTFDAKQKPADSCFQPKEGRSNKIQKLEVVEGEESCNYVKNNAENVLEGKDDDGVDGASLDAGDEKEDYEDEDDSEEDEKSSGKVAANRKGEGIMKDDKGNRKLIEEDDDDNEDSSDDGSDLDSEESNLSDDPLAEIDLDNILPLRTRRRTVHPRVYFATDLANDDDNSSDSDA